MIASENPFRSIGIDSYYRISRQHWLQEKQAQLMPVKLNTDV